MTNDLKNKLFAFYKADGNSQKIEVCVFRT